MKMQNEIKAERRIHRHVAPLGTFLVKAALSRKFLFILYKYVRSAQLVKRYLTIRCIITHFSSRHDDKCTLCIKIKLHYFIRYYYLNNDIRSIIKQNTILIIIMNDSYSSTMLINSLSRI